MLKYQSIPSTKIFSFTKSLDLTKNFFGTKNQIGQKFKNSITKLAEQFVDQKVNTKPTTFLKITNRDENHFKFQYKDGLNILREPFNDNPKESCCAGGFYFTTDKHIDKFYNLGDNLRVVELPHNDPDFKMVMDPKQNKWRANKIILKEKYPLSKPSTYEKFGLKLPSLADSIDKGYTEIIDYLVDKFGNNKEMPKELKQTLSNKLLTCIDRSHFDMAKFLIEKGADVNAENGDPLVYSAIVNSIDMVKYLISKGANINIDKGRPLRAAAKYGHLDIVKYLVENGAYFNDGEALRSAINAGHIKISDYLFERHLSTSSDPFAVIKFFVENGIDSLYARIQQKSLLYSVVNNHYEIVKYLLESGPNITLHDHNLITASLKLHDNRIFKLLFKKITNIDLDNSHELRRVIQQERFNFFRLPIILDQEARLKVINIAKETLRKDNLNAMYIY